MEHNDSLIEHYRSLKPRRFSYVERLELFPETSEDFGMSLTLIIELLSDTLEAQNLHLSFYGVKDLQIHIGLDYIQFQEFQITPIRNYQWEGLKYQVTNSDTNRLSFFCRSFVAEVVADKNKEGFSDSEG